MGAFLAIGGAVVSGLFSSRAANKQAKADKAASELSVRGNMWDRQFDRRNQLQDREYKERAIGGYRDFYKGSRPLMSPAYTDPGSQEVIDPFAKKKK
jgi:hypothetical protein